MRRLVAGAVALAAAGLGVARWVTARGRVPAPARDPLESSRWLGITINRPPEEVAPAGHLPEPLARVDAEVRMNKAPGDRGTEIYARPREHRAGAEVVVARLRGEDARTAVRTALRETKSLLETGDVLRPDEEIGTTRPTLPGKVLDMALGRASEGGRL
ncbi:hypothetical protein GCM10010116_26830 [Microbispora rosea subsp. aerata]|nr:hypothetical protein [Microbispora rosea]GGO13329.1 hypothetical protein GCM10010116_26830 [Microbispora rosea subsp. aerata]GIH58491.1 hypothetical protein Mro02_54050 [Microbispora rosea subsp. aerata]GLJ86662.1 hypothetical protein GCM10017588_54000 [Microbispora rosea subsp. aerata]